MDRGVDGGNDPGMGATTTRNNEDRDALAEQVARLESALGARDSFLRVATHELRGPLAAIQLQADTISLLVKQGADVAEVDARAVRVSGQVQRLARLLEEVLDLARASSGRLQLLRGEVDLTALVQGELTRAREELRRAGCEVAIESAPAIVGAWDQARIEHSVAAVVHAACRSGGGGPINVAVAATGGEALVEVRWSGTGLAAAQVALVAGNFEAAVNGAAPGANILALWLAARVAEAHGGRLELESTRAMLRLPLAGKKLAP